ncbi:PEP-CTERM sorting domain-containing protein [Bythopirellula goksoeyrii]|uniref:PEP-CTERM protein-sorting domain-containing protein n=1 Tax=Bythopirellula goksoeyrii TaxID=1400387 RepID=A0A5B9QAR1_9BACT|nr:PEP-CTERM sorting domain-containing protein [Bythopirellula goksoeyrii]QEG33976.1 hypothetical protein Pr1d_12470 [Bythopirellula goksoeyrii]
MKTFLMTSRFILAVAVACTSYLSTENTFGQFLPDPILLDSFEGVGGISDWSTQNDYVAETENSIYISHSQSTTGVTNGANSLALEMNSGSGWGVSLSASFTDIDTGLYDAFNTVAANPAGWYLEGDLTLDASSWANVSNPIGPPFVGLFQMNVALNSDASFTQAFATADVWEQETQIPLRINMNDLNPVQDSDVFQFFLGGSHVFAAGGTPEAPLGAIAYLDNLRFVPAPPSVPVTISSWEVGATDYSNDWSDCGLGCMDDPPSGHTGSHVHTIVANSPAATDGTRVLQIDNTRQNDPGLFPNGFAFHWGSTIELNSNIGTPEAPVIDSGIQGRIDELRELINSASAFAFDIHFEDLFNGNAVDPFSPAPAFMRVALAVNDGTGSFFQAEGTALAGTPDANATDTFQYIIGTNIMTDVSTDLGILSEVGLTDTNQLNVFLALNSDGGLLAQIDNFRVIIEVDLSADFNNDGKVDENDLVVWQNAYGANANGDADGDGDSDGKDFLAWQRTYGVDATQSSVALSKADMALLGIGVGVPEPTTGILLLFGSVLLGSSRRRSA